MNPPTLGLVDVQLKCFDVQLEDMTVGTMVGMAEIPHIVVACGLEDSKDFVWLGNCSVDKASKLVDITEVIWKSFSLAIHQEITFHAHPACPP